MEVLAQVERLDSVEGEGLQSPWSPVQAAEIGKEEGLERSVYHEARMPFDALSIGLGIVDAMRVHGRRQEAEQHD
jgi:hypothetical protein